jgi:hypothetical protein
MILPACEFNKDRAQSASVIACVLQVGKLRLRKGAWESDPSAGAALRAILSEAPSATRGSDSLEGPVHAQEGVSATIRKHVAVSSPTSTHPS